MSRGLVLSIFEVSFGSVSLLSAMLFTYLFFMYHRQHYFQNRRLPLVVIEIVADIIMIGSRLVFRSLILSRGGYTVASRLAIQTERRYNYTCQLFGNVIFLSAIILRIYFLQYDHNFKQATMHSTWANQLTLFPAKENWYLEHKSTYGNLFWVSKRFAPFVIFMAGIHVVLIWMDKIWLSFAVNVATVFPFLVFCLLVRRGLPDDYDTIFLRYELTWTVGFFLLFMIYVSMLAARLLCPELEETGDARCYVSAAINDLIWLSDVFLATVVVIWFNEKRRSTEADANEVLQGERTWMEFVNTNTRNFEVFARFLVREFSVESLLFLTEYTKFKETYRAQFGSISMVKQGTMDSELNVEPAIVAIPEEFESPTSFCLAGQMLFKKYIDPGKASHEINVSYNSRTRLQKLFSADVELEELNKRELVESFNDCEAEVTHLLMDSYHRFRS